MKEKILLSKNEMCFLIRDRKFDVFVKSYLFYCFLEAKGIKVKQIKKIGFLTGSILSVGPRK